MYNSLGVSSNASVDECDVVSTIAGPTIIMNPGVDDGKNVANTDDLVNGVHSTKKKKNNKKKKKKKILHPWSETGASLSTRVVFTVARVTCLPFLSSK